MSARYEAVFTLYVKRKGLCKFMPGSKLNKRRLAGLTVGRRGVGEKPFEGFAPTAPNKKSYKAIRINTPPEPHPALGYY
jgi:hypothetical protein